MKKTLLLSEGSVTNSLITLNLYVPEFKKDFNVIFITFAHSEEVRRKTKEEGIALYEIPFSDKKTKSNRDYILKNIRYIEGMIKFPVQKIIFSDPEFYKIYVKNEILALDWFIRIFNFYERLIKEKNIQIHFSVGSDRIFNFLPHLILKSLSRKSYTLIFVPYYGFVLTSDFFGTFTENIKTNSKIDYRKYIKPIIEKSVDYVDELNIKKHLNKKIFRKVKKIIIRDIEEKQNLYRSKGNLTTNYILFFAPNLLKTKIKTYFMKKLIYKKINPNQKYIYYPLLYTEDAQIRLKYPEGYNQYELIRNIAKNIPLEYKLIVKEHPAWKGQYSFKELHDISKLPNVVVVHPNLSSKKIFPFIDYVVTVNSTVGYEALFFNKVVFIIGTPFYKDFPGVIKISLPSELFRLITNQKLIKEKKREIEKRLKIRVEELLANSIKLDYEEFLSTKDTKKGIQKIALMLKKLAYK